MLFNQGETLCYERTAKEKTSVDRGLGRIIWRRNILMRS